jgi:hypothetical protein
MLSLTLNLIPDAMSRLLTAPRITAVMAALYLTLHIAPAWAETDAEKQAAAKADAEERAKRAAQAKEDAAKAPPPAIPGAVSDAEPAPATKNAAEMSPNDALFDAINRGDGAAARDAVNRGAQIEARNVLGQTPLDAAIEANRNDITFLLLSLRGTMAAGGPRPGAAGGPRPGAAGGPRPAHGVPVAKAAAHAGRLPHPARAVARAPVDRGTPNPAVGFNGF